MYLNLVAIAALLAIASVMHKIPQIEVTVPTKIMISANLEYESKNVYLISFTQFLSVGAYLILSGPMNILQIHPALLT